MYLSEYSEVCYLEGYNVAFVKWKKFCCNEDYRKPLEYALEIIRKHKCDYVADTRNGFENIPEDTKWVAEYFMPKAVEYGCRCIYFIIDKNNSLKDELEGQQKDSEGIIEFRYIYDLKDISMQSERLILRAFEESDAENVYKYASDSDVGPIAGWPPHKTVEESLDVIRNVFSTKETYAVCLKDNKAIGAISLKLKGETDMTDKDDECELGYWLGKPFWGQGLMPEAVNLLLRHAFLNIGMKKVWCGYYDGNEKSRRVQEKCGFKYQWTTPDVDVPLMNEVRIGHVNCLTKEEWFENQMWQAAKEGNKQEFEKFVSADAVMVCGGYRCTGEQYAEFVSDFGISDFEITDFEVVNKTDKTVQVHYIVKTTADAPENSDLAGTFHVTSTWEKRNGEWILVFNMDSRIMG